jgi:hypothetical protein
MPCAGVDRAGMPRGRRGGVAVTATPESAVTGLTGAQGIDAREGRDTGRGSTRSAKARSRRVSVGRRPVANGGYDATAPQGEKSAAEMNA